MVYHSAKSPPVEHNFRKRERRVKGVAESVSTVSRRMTVGLQTQCHQAGCSTFVAQQHY